MHEGRLETQTLEILVTSLNTKTNKAYTYPLKTKLTDIVLRKGSLGPQAIYYISISFH